MVDRPREEDRDNLAAAEGDAEPLTWPESRRKLRHDARNALNQIIGYSEMLREQAEADELAEFGDDLGKITAAGRRLQHLIDQLVTLEQRSASAPGGDRATTPTRSPAPPAARMAEEDDCFDPSAASILVVDDNEMNRDLLTRRLRLKGYQVESAKDGAQALRMVEAGAFDLLLLDVNMPGIDGLEVLATLRQQRAMGELPVIMATARDASEDVVAALQAGANDYVTKPLDMPVVLARTHCQLALKWARDEVGRLNRNLQAAQTRIAELVDSSADALADLSAWTSTVARDLTTMLGADEITAWVLERDSLTPLVETASAPPDPTLLEALRHGGRLVEKDGYSAVAITGFTGESLGLLIVRGGRALRNNTAAHLVFSFARQLGSALELRHARQELAEVERRRRLQRDEMLERGIDLLQICPECGACYDQSCARCGEDDAPLEMSEPFPFRVAGRYRLVKVLGQGGMGVVYRAHDERLDRPVAVKVVSADQFEDDTLRLRFENEARTVAAIEHPGVIAVYDSGEVEDGSLFIVMELLQGHELGALVDAFGPGRPRQVAALLRQLGAGLTAAHQAGIVHRDIKPANIVLTAVEDGLRAKLLDFGVAKQIAMETSLTQTGTIIGTPRYMSPEQITGRSVDARSDLYSFAAVIYLALTGHDVTPSRGFAEVLVDVVQVQPPPLSFHCAAIPGALDDLFARSLAKAPDDRPANISLWANEVADLLEELPAWSDGWVITEGPLPPPPPADAAGGPAPQTTKIVKSS